MDVKRIVLYLALAVVGYLMIIQWNKDYHEPQAPTSAEVQTDNGSAAQPSGSDDETLQFGQTQSTTELQDSSAAGTDQSTINVRTDLLDLKISPKGGDIVYAALLDHKLRVNGDQPYVLLENSSKRFYILQSALQGLGNDKRLQLKADKPSYRLQDGQDTLVVNLSGEVNGVKLVKRFTLERDSYQVKVDYLLDNQSGHTIKPSFIGLIKRDNSEDPSKAQGMGMSSFLGAAYSTDESRYEKIKFEDIGKQNFQQTSMGGWVAMLQHYFISAWIPPQDTQNLFSTRSDRQGNNIIGFKTDSSGIANGDKGELSGKVYLGPKIQSRLEAAAPNLDLAVDFGWLWFIAQPLFWLLDHIHDLVGNWGVSIILLTVMIKAAFFKLSATAYRSMAKMRAVGPKLQQIREQYADDRQKLSQAMMELYRKEKINPMGGCLPILVQMPVFIALYWMLMESVELRHAPFILWINDLSVKDPFFVLPILMGISMFVQQLLNPTPPDPMQAKVMKMLPIVFTFFFLWFPAGLVLYWLVNNLLSILQQWLITRGIEKEGLGPDKS